MAGMDHGAMAAGASAAAGHGNSHSMSGMNMSDKSLVPDSVKVGVGVDAIAMSPIDRTGDPRSEEHTSALPSLMCISYPGLCFNNKTHASDPSTITLELFEL